MNTYWFMSLFKFNPFCPVEEWNIEITKQVAVAITEHGKPVNTRLCHTVGENYQPHSEILGIESCQNGPCVPVPNVGSTTKLVFHSVLKSLDYSFHTFDYFMSEQTTTKIYILIF